MVMLSCHFEVNQPQLTADVIVTGVGGDCNGPLLDFGNRQNELDKIVGETNSYSLYYAFDLDERFRVAGTRLTVTVQKSTESRACKAVGPAYQTVSVVQATLSK